jgi:hypothetical protein
LPSSFMAFKNHILFNHCYKYPLPIEFIYHYKLPKENSCCSMDKKGTG